MIRVIIICEGETEVEFCNTILAPHFHSIGIKIQCPRIKKSMGGIVKWKEIKSNYLVGFPLITQIFAESELIYLRKSALSAGNYLVVSSYNKKTN